MFHRLAVLFCASLVGFWTTNASADNRDLLWRVVQGCVLNHSITGAAFPCLAVEMPKGTARGYAVLRAPADRTRIIASPTVRTSGIEAKRLRGPDAPNYFQDAWTSRHFVTDGLPTQPSRDDLAMAINSKFGRSQDQMHIHVACIRADVKQMIAGQRRKIKTGEWTPIKVLPYVPTYMARFQPGSDLDGVNLFDEAARGLKMDADAMGDVTIVVLGATTMPGHGGPGFIVLARRKLPHGLDGPHGEALLDPACAAFRTPRD